MAQQQPVVNHHQCFPEYRRNGERTGDTGLDRYNQAFQQSYLQGDINFDLECLGCCLGYLVRERGYHKMLGQFTRVVFTDRDLNDPNCFYPSDINAYVNTPSGGGRRGQIATREDSNLGVATIRCFQASHTYQLYSETGNLSIGIQGSYRLESIAIDVVKAEELHNVYFNIADATLIEKYREKYEMRSLSDGTEENGVCLIEREQLETNEREQLETNEREQLETNEREQLETNDPTPLTMLTDRLNKELVIDDGSN